VPIVKFSAAPIGYHHAAPPWRLISLNLNVGLSNLARALRRLDSALSFVALHLRLEEDGHGKRETIWQVIFHGIVVGASVSKVRRVLDPICPPPFRVSSPRPAALKISRCPDLSSGIRSCIKPHFRRHVLYLDRSGRPITRTRSLKCNQLLDVAQVLGGHDLENRHMLIGGRWFNFISAPADRYPFNEE
jgi:hypothetical protein